MAGYWIIFATEKDDAAALAEYRRLWPPLAERYGARIISGYGRTEFREGEPQDRGIIVEFASYEDAVACYDDPEYQASKVFSDRGYNRSLAIVEGQ